MSPKDALLSTAAIAAALALTSCGSSDDELPPDEPTQQSSAPSEDPTESTETEEPAAMEEPAEESESDEGNESEEPSNDDGVDESETPNLEETSEEGSEEDSEAVDLSGFSTELQASEDFTDFQLDVGHNTMQVLDDVRLGSHEGYERIVLEYALDTDLAHQAQYIEPGSQGEGFSEVPDDLTGASCSSTSSAPPADPRPRPPHGPSPGPRRPRRRWCARSSPASCSAARARC
ncbi:hypothetical protein BCL67_11018 [Nesterenkonia sandarakina]|uniref:Uncharacterized protein n=2 Tax=Nesterenkonia sandarakina TaxID=272918 RepID=A0A2T0YIF5_9MICC|nr:hypothetical protein BCL67_11018 [Nesterenkonia sandarakina]